MLKAQELRHRRWWVGRGVGVSYPHLPLKIFEIGALKWLEYWCDMIVKRHAIAWSETRFVDDKKHLKHVK